MGRARRAGREGGEGGLSSTVSNVSTAATHNGLIAGAMSGLPPAAAADCLQHRPGRPSHVDWAEEARPAAAAPLHRCSDIPAWISLLVNVRRDLFNI